MQLRRLTARHGALVVKKSMLELAREVWAGSAPVQSAGCRACWAAHRRLGWPSASRGPERHTGCHGRTAAGIRGLVVGDWGGGVGGVGWGERGGSSMYERASGCTTDDHSSLECSDLDHKLVQAARCASTVQRRSLACCQLPAASPAAHLLNDPHALVQLVARCQLLRLQHQGKNAVQKMQKCTRAMPACPPVQQARAPAG